MLDYIPHCGMTHGPRIVPLSERFLVLATSGSLVQSWCPLTASPFSQIYFINMESLLILCRMLFKVLKSRQPTRE